MSSGPSGDPDGDKRMRILKAAMEAFVEHGYAAATTLDIATRARVSKRELYALVGNKERMLEACVAGRGQRMRLPAEFPAPVDAASLRTALRLYALTLLGELTQPGVLAMFRLAISEWKRSPGVAASLYERGRKPARAALESLLRQALAANLLRGTDVPAMISHFQRLLWGDFYLWVLVGIEKPPAAKEMERRASEVADVFLALHGR